MEKNDASLEAAAHLLGAVFEGASVEIAIILGSGLGEAIGARITGVAIPYAELPGIPAPGVCGHDGIAHAGRFAGRRIVAFAGRPHLYAGYSAREATTLIRLASAVGAAIIILTNAAGGLDPTMTAGDLLVIADHLNLTGATPLDFEDGAFLDLRDAYSPRLRALVSRHAGAFVQRSGIYAGVRGPAYETPAEARMLRTMGADLVGMSTVLETIAARKLGMEVLALSLVTNVHGTAEPLDHAEVVKAARQGTRRLTEMLETLLPAL